MIKNQLGQNLVVDWILKIDRWLLFLVLCLIVLGFVMVGSASPAVSQKINLDDFHFIEKHIKIMIFSISLMILISFANRKIIINFSILLSIILLIMLILVPIIGDDIKGSKRWLRIFNQSIQPSEIIIPFCVTINALILTNKNKFIAYNLSMVLVITIVSLFLLQPDVGLSILIITTYISQLLVAGIPLIFFVVLIIIAVIALVFAYYSFPHVEYRLNTFIDKNNQHYQMKKSLEAFSNGDLLGQGPGEGIVKQYLPDAHTDFIFAVIGEEMGALFCIIVVIIYGSFVVKSLLKAINTHDKFEVYTITGLAVQFGLHAVINIGVTINLLPAKGMTLPFISYGGSSALASAITVGIILALTKKKYGSENFINYD